MIRRYQNVPDWRPATQGATAYAWNIQIKNEFAEQHHVWQEALVKAIYNIDNPSSPQYRAAALLHEVGLTQDRCFLHYRDTGAPINWGRLYVVLDALSDYLDDATQLFLVSESYQLSLVVKRNKIGRLGWHVAMSSVDGAKNVHTTSLLWDKDVVLL